MAYVVEMVWNCYIVTINCLIIISQHDNLNRAKFCSFMTDKTNKIPNSSLKSQYLSIKQQQQKKDLRPNVAKINWNLQNSLRCVYVYLSKLMGNPLVLHKRYYISDNVTKNQRFYTTITHSGG